VAPGAAVRELAAPIHGAGALEGLYEAHAPDLRRRCLRLTRDAHAADDLMQEVFVRFITRFPEPPVGMNVGAYLHATARNVLWKQLRDSHETSDGDIETTVGADDDLDRDPERSALLVEQQSLVRRCAAVLTGRQRRALTLRDVEGYSYAEIGSELGIGPGAVMAVISRARARLRVAVRRANVDLDNLAPECMAMLGPLSDYLDGRAASTDAEVESHLATCDDCCQTLASFQEAGSRLRGFLPFVPLGGVLSRLRGKSHGGGSSLDPVSVSTPTHAPALARLGNALGHGGESPLGIAGVGAMVTAALIAVAGGGIVVAQHVGSGSGSGHALVSAAPKPKPSIPAAAAISIAAPTSVPRAAQTARPYGGHPYSPSVAPLTSGAAATPASSAAKVATGTPSAPALTPKQAAPAADPATGGRTAPLPKTTPIHVPVVAKPAVRTPVKVPAVKVPAVKVPAVKVPAVKVPAIKVPAVVPVVKVPVVKVPVVTVPKVTTPAVTTPVVTTPTVVTPTVPSTPTVPPVQTPAVPLGASASFAVLAGAGVTNTGLSALTGDLGSFPTPSITGLASLTLAGLNQAGGAVAQQAKADLVTAYDSAVAKTSTEAIAADLGGRTFGPGVYRSASSIGLTGALTLDGRGDPNAVFVFQAGSTLTTASASQVLLVNGARSCNVFWQVGSSATLGTGSTFRGSILALTSVTVTTGVTIDGRVLARNGAVTLDTDTIARSGC
jgi:RNA polymerase sigma factor (sigma-70 family)